MQADYFCRNCRTPFLNANALNDDGVCAACTLRQEANFDSAYSYGSYEGALRDLIHLYKYAKVESLADPLSRLLTQAIPLSDDFDVVMAMPMHWLKQWQRGFNQAELIAEPIARRYGLKLSRNLGRKRYTKAQAGLDESARRANLKGSFKLRRPAEIHAKRILLIDDVFTTGSTLRAATGVLKAAGAARVTALTLARVDKGFEQSTSVRPMDGRRSHTAGTGVK